MLNRAIDKHLSRREALRLAAAGVSGVSLSQWLPQLAAHAAEQPRRHKACILLWMDGGPSQTDTFDPKPDAPAEYRGHYRTIATSVPGLHIAEGYARLSRWMHHAAVIRGMRTDEATEHWRGRIYMHTSYRPNFAGLNYPTLGSIVAAQRPANQGLPNFVVTGKTMLNFPHVAGAGYLGPRHNGLILRDLTAGLENSHSRLTSVDFDERTALAERLAEQFQRTAPVPAVATHRTAYQGALELMRSNRSHLFDLAREPAHMRDRYGRHEFGQGCLLARRLVEAGVPFVEVYLSDWDTHEQRRSELVRDTLLPVSDQAITALLSDLVDRGLLGTRLLFGWVSSDVRRGPMTTTVRAITTTEPGPLHYSVAACMAARSSAAPMPTLRRWWIAPSAAPSSWRPFSTSWGSIRQATCTPAAGQCSWSLPAESRCANWSEPVRSGYQVDRNLWQKSGCPRPRHRKSQRGPLQLGGPLHPGQQVSGGPQV
jgi:hypothetical protein